MKKSTKIIVSVIAFIAAASAVTGKIFGDYVLNTKYKGFTTSKLPHNGSQKHEEFKTRTKKYAEWLEENSEDIFLLTKDNVKVHALLCKTEKISRKYIIMCHGYKGRAQDLGFQAYNFRNMGYNVLSVDARASGKTQGKFVGMGYIDKSDLKGYINFVLARDPQAQIVLYGISMGASEVMMAAGEQLPQNVKAVVEDSGFTSVWDILGYQLKETMRLPVQPILFLGSLYAKLRTGLDFKRASAAEAVKNTSLPILFIHGTKDKSVPFEMFGELYESCNSEKEAYVVEGADHMHCDLAAPEKYYGCIEDFLNKYIK